MPSSKNYLVLESLIDCSSKAVHILNFSEKEEFDIGRRISNDITVSDISVSRCQATIKLVKNKVFLADTNSKFGSFVLIQNPIILYSNKDSLPIQIEKKCFFFKNINVKTSFCANLFGRG